MIRLRNQPQNSAESVAARAIRPEHGQPLGWSHQPAAQGGQQLGGIAQGDPAAGGQLGGRVGPEQHFDAVVGALLSRPHLIVQVLAQ